MNNNFIPKASTRQLLEYMYDLMYTVFDILINRHQCPDAQYHILLNRHVYTSNNKMLTAFEYIKSLLLNTN